MRHVTSFGNIVGSLDLCMSAGVVSIVSSNSKRVGGIACSGGQAFTRSHRCTSCFKHIVITQAAEDVCASGLT